MRPVNLIPPEDRRGDQAPLRRGPLAYILLGALVLLLVGVVALVLTGNQISEREEQVATLEAEDAAAEAKAASLSAYTEFRDLSEARVQTVQSLADSRFDWERVMRELALILPGGDVWLISLTATAAPGAAIGGEGGGSSGGSGGSGGNLRGAILGPALELSGCAASQTSVAGFVTALEDIDGVTRVGVQSSQLADKDSGAGVSSGGSGGSGSSDDCRTRSFIAKFELVVAFDAAPLPPSEGEGELVPEAAQAASSETAEGG
ncbi:MAG TPA: PilN domain-containing protein [Solirubrobacterales bacterium]